jgi:hypothetical protein
MIPKRLKDCRWDIPNYQWDDTTLLNNPRIRIENVNYNAPTLTALIEVRFRENQGAAAFEHSKVFPYILQEDSQESIGAENVQLFIAAIFPNAIEITE